METLGVGNGELEEEVLDLGVKTGTEEGPEGWCQAASDHAPIRCTLGRELEPSSHLQDRAGQIVALGLSHHPVVL